jgi:hypothetical protein
MRKTLFEMALLLHPTADEIKAGKDTVVLVEPKQFLASDQQTATILASREIPEEHLDKLDRVEVAVRPF